MDKPLYFPELLDAIPDEHYVWIGKEKHGPFDYTKKVALIGNRCSEPRCETCMKKKRSS